MIRVQDKTGTNAGWRRIRTAGLTRCKRCDGYVSPDRARAGSTMCVRCNRQ